jgi:hypothetical protein
MAINHLKEETVGARTKNLGRGLVQAEFTSLDEKKAEAVFNAQNRSNPGTIPFNAPTPHR